MKKKCKLFVVFHQTLQSSYYADELLDDYIFVNVNPKNDLSLVNEKYEIVNQYELGKFYSLGKWYTESEVIYNVYKNEYLYEDLKYIGFLQHDIDSSILNGSNITELTDKYDHINFQPYLFQTDYNQQILMDINHPNRRSGKGVNCYDVILKDYNEYYGTNFTIDSLYGKTINLCASFVLTRDLFVEMMKFISSIIESGKLDHFDQERRYRIQGGYLERYYALWIALKELTAVELKLNHFFAESTIQDSLINRVLRKFGLRK
jgi:hypothetical protein